MNKYSGLCQKAQNVKITPATDTCSGGDFVKKGILTHSHYIIFVS